MTEDCAPPQTRLYRLLVRCAPHQPGGALACLIRYPFRQHWPQIHAADTALIEVLTNHVAVNLLQPRRETVEFKQVPGSGVAANPERLGEGVIGEQLFKTAS